MYIELMDVFWLLFLSVVLFYWWNAQGVKQQVVAAVKKHCQAMDVQLLDDGVVLRRVWLKRDHRGYVKLQRCYSFEFSSTGDERYQGEASVLGRHIEEILLAPHRLN